jgi:hypothetical protein
VRRNGMQKSECVHLHPRNIKGCAKALEVDCHAPLEVMFVLLDQLGFPLAADSPGLRQEFEKAGLEVAGDQGGWAGRVRTLYVGACTHEAVDGYTQFGHALLDNTLGCCCMLG